MVLLNVLGEGDVDVAPQEGVVLGLDEVLVVLFHRLPQLTVGDGVGLLDAVEVLDLLVEALHG